MRSTVRFNSTLIRRVIFVIGSVILLLIFGFRFFHIQLINQVADTCIYKLNQSLESFTTENYAGNTFIYVNYNTPFNCRKVGNFGKPNSNYAIELNYSESADAAFANKRADRGSDRSTIITQQENILLIEKYNDQSGFSVLARRDAVVIDFSVASGVFAQTSDQEVTKAINDFIELVPVDSFMAVNRSPLHNWSLLTGEQRIGGELKIQQKTYTYVTNTDQGFYAINEQWK